MNTTGKKFGGRMRGTPNKNTKDLRAWITAFIESNTAQIEEDWQTLEPKDRIVLFEKLLKYSLPQLQAVSTKIDFESMSDDDLQRVIDELKRSSKE
jgi:hypothetical protein